MKDNDLISRQSLLKSLNRFAPEHFNALVNDLIMKEPAASFPQRHENDHIAEVSKKATQPEQVRTQMSSADCISRADVNRVIEDWFRTVFGTDSFRKTGLCRELRELPSAQPEIIRCASCKWFQYNMRPDGYLPKGIEEFECRHWCGPCDPVDFCSYAERRTDEYTD